MLLNQWSSQRETSSNEVEVQNKRCLPAYRCSQYDHLQSPPLLKDASDCKVLQAMYARDL